MRGPGIRNAPVHLDALLTGFAVGYETQLEAPNLEADVIPLWKLRTLFDPPPVPVRGGGQIGHRVDRGSQPLDHWSLPVSEARMAVVPVGTAQTWPAGADEPFGRRFYR